MTNATNHAALAIAARAVTLVTGIDMSLASQPGRRTMARPSVLRQGATDLTGKVYPANRKGLEAARADLTTLITEMQA